jgi:hypothetical protein
MKNDFHEAGRRAFLKGLAIGAGGYFLGAGVIHPQAAMGQSIPEYLDRIPMEMRWRIASNSTVINEVNWAKALLDKEGREKFLEIRKRFSPAGGASAKKLAESFGLTGSDAKSAAAIIPAMVAVYYGPQQKYEIEESSAEKARVSCLECSFWNQAQRRNITDDLCSLHSRLHWQGFAEALNPDLKVAMLKAKPLGDPVCEWLLELRA